MGAGKLQESTALACCSIAFEVKCSFCTTSFLNICHSVLKRHDSGSNLGLSSQHPTSNILLRGNSRKASLVKYSKQ